MRPFCPTILVMCFVGSVTGWAASGQVAIVQTPNGGIQPQAYLDRNGVLHLVYFKGTPSAGDLYYVRREAGKEGFTAPLRVNSRPDSAVATGTIRGGQLAIGKNGRVHVAWNGSAKAQPRGPMNESPMLYSRMNDAGTAFEAQRNMLQTTHVLDGGGTVAADDSGNVYVAWHGLALAGERGEDNRKPWVARSADEGKTFTQEEPVYAKHTGACGCCAMRAFTDKKGSVYVLYRSATEVVHRDMYLLFSNDKGKNFQEGLVHPWETRICPMSSETFGEGTGGVFVAWETEGQIYFARINPATFEVAKPQVVPGAGNGRKHPTLAFSDRGDMILAWTEGTGWQKGGALAWQVFDKSGKATQEKGRIQAGIPVWGLPAAVAGRDGKFQVFH